MSTLRIGLILGCLVAVALALGAGAQVGRMVGVWALAFATGVAVGTEGDGLSRRWAVTRQRILARRAQRQNRAASLRTAI